MYSAWSSALISGTVAALAMAIGGAVQLTSYSTPDRLPVALIVGAAAVTALLAGALVTVAVRGGLLLARCRQLTGRFALFIALGNIALLDILDTVPVETRAVKLDMPTDPSSSVPSSPVVPLTFWLTIVAALLVPVMVAYVIGRIAGGRASAA